MSQTVAKILVDVLEEIGVRHMFGLIADSLNPIGDVVRQSSKIEWIGVRHEEGGALAAAGQAKLTGRLGVCCGSTGPGSTHLIAGLYEASRDHAPVLAISGDMPRQLEGIDYFQATAPNMLFKDVSLYTETISSPAQAPAVIHEAIAAAYAGRGVAHLTIPVDVLMAKADRGVPSVRTLKPSPEVVASEDNIAEMASRIDKASNIVVMCGAGCHGAAEELRALSDRLKAPLIHSVKGKDIMPFDDPRWMGGIGMIGTKADYYAVTHCDLFLMLGADYPYSEFLPRECVVIQVDERARVLGRRAPTEFGVVGSVRPTVQSLLGQVKAKSDRSFFDSITDKRKAWNEVQDKQADPARSKDVIHPQAVARMVSDLAKRDSVFVIDTGLNTLWSGNWLRQSGEQRIIGSFNNGAVGTALGQANGIQALDRSRQVIALCGDGGFNMLMCEFLTAVQHKLAVKAVVYNNSSLGLIRFEAESMGLPAWKAMDFPNPDYVALARACGAVGFKAEKPNELRDAIDQALKADGPAIVSCVVPPDEMPNFPHLDLEKAENFVKAKIKEKILAFTGG
jgi:thiamine pyrophosphate-dependent acetolactate synthase large subunit-like protein